jgi:hypothetical protein
VKAFRLALLADDSDTEEKDDPMSTDQKIPDDQEKPEEKPKDTPDKDEGTPAVDDEGKMGAGDNGGDIQPGGGDNQEGDQGDTESDASGGDGPAEEVNPITDPDVDPEDRPRPELDQLHVVKVGEQSAEENRQLELKKDTK